MVLIFGDWFFFIFGDWFFFELAGHLQNVAEGDSCHRGVSGSSLGELLMRVCKECTQKKCAEEWHPDGPLGGVVEATDFDPAIGSLSDDGDDAGNQEHDDRGDLTSHDETWTALCLAAIHQKKVMDHDDQDSECPESHGADKDHAILSLGLVELVAFSI